MYLYCLFLYYLYPFFLVCLHTYIFIYILTCLVTYLFLRINKHTFFTYLFVLYNQTLNLRGKVFKCVIELQNIKSVKFNSISRYKYFVPNPI